MQQESSAVLKFSPKKIREVAQKVLSDGNFPFAPHLHYTKICDDHIPQEREKGIKCGLEFLKTCDEILVYIGKGITEGMQIEIENI